MHNACRKAPAKVMIMNASGKNTFQLFINKLVLSQTRHLHSGLAFNREMHLNGLHREDYYYNFFWFSSFLQIYFLCLWAGSLLWRAPFTETAWYDRKHIQKWQVYKLFPQEKIK